MRRSSHAVRARVAGAAAVLAAATVAPGAAAADDAPTAAVERPPNLDTARKAILTGKLAPARAEIDRVIASPTSPEERSAAAELLFVVDLWLSTGGRAPRAIFEVGAEEAPLDDWEERLSSARRLLVRGAFAPASRRLAVLAATAPNVVARARAVELTLLARELAGEAERRAALERELAADADSPAPQPKTQEIWYGWQTLVVDGVALAVTLTGAAVAGSSNRNEGAGAFIALMGGLTYVLGPPIVHGAHGNGVKALASAGMRLGAPTLLTFGGALAGAALGDSSNDELEGAAVGAVLGFLAGYGLAVSVDAAVLAREKVEISPRVSASPNGATLGFGGSF